LEKFPSGASNLENAKMTLKNYEINNLKMAKLSSYAVALIRAAVEDWEEAGEVEFIGFLSGISQCLIFKIYQDESFWLDDEGTSDEAFAARDWVRIHISDPFYGVSILMVWVDLKTGRLNIDGEIARYSAAVDVDLRIEAYLEQVVFPAIQERIANGGNRDDFPDEKCFRAKIDEIAWLLMRSQSKNPAPFGSGARGFDRKI
jgi:hypothetical protein